MVGIYLVGCRFGAEGKRSNGDSETLRDEGGRRNAGGNFRDSSSSFSDNRSGEGDSDVSGGGGGNEWRDDGYGTGGEGDDGMENQGGWGGFGSKKQEKNDPSAGYASKKAPGKFDQRQNKQQRAGGAGAVAVGGGGGGRRSNKGATLQQRNDLPRFNKGGPQKKKPRGVGGGAPGVPGNGGYRESAAALENRGSGVRRGGSSSSSSSNRPQPSSEPKRIDRQKMKASSRGDGEEVCPGEFHFFVLRNPRRNRNTIHSSETACMICMHSFSCDIFPQNQPTPNVVPCGFCLIPPRC